MTVMKLDRITSNPKRMNGQPCIRNLRLTVRRVIELLATYPNREELHQEFPELEDEDIRQALIFASSYLDDRIIYPRLPKTRVESYESYESHLFYYRG